MGLFNNNNANQNHNNNGSGEFSSNSNSGGGRGVGGGSMGYGGRRRAVSSCLVSCCCGDDDSQFDGGGGGDEGYHAHRRHSDNSHHSDSRFPSDGSNFSQRMSHRGSFNDRSMTGPLTTCWCQELFEYIRIYYCSCSSSTATGRWRFRSSTFVRTLYRFSRSPTYKILYSFFSLFLLFGPAVQDLVLSSTSSSSKNNYSRAGDVVFETVRTAMLAYFVIDIIIKWLTENGYVDVHCCGANTGGVGGGPDGATTNNNNSNGVPGPSGGVSSGGGGGAGTAAPSMLNLLDINNNMNNNNGDSLTSSICCCTFGSFLFWCDVISTGSILYDLSYVNPDKSGERVVEITLQGSTPVSGFDAYDRPLGLVDLELNLLIVIARTARCARFVQSRAVVGLSNKVNWFWALNQIKWMNPFYYYDRFHRHQIQQQQMNAAVSSLGVEGGMGSTRGVGDRHDEKMMNNNSSSNNSWGALQIGILAAVHAQAEAEAQRDAAANRRGGMVRSFWIRVKDTLRSVGLLSNDTSRTARHQAAIKIQRAWRNHVRYETPNSDDGFGDVDYVHDMEDPLTGSQSASTHRSKYVIPIDASNRGRKRSTLASFSTMNAKSGGRLNKSDIRASAIETDAATGSRFQSQAGNGRESQVGSDMRELTGQRVAIGVFFAFVCTVLFTFTSSNTTQPTTMVVLHKQTQFVNYQSQALAVARNTSVPELYQYQPANDDQPVVIPGSQVDQDSLRPRDTLVISVSNDDGTSIGWFDYTSDTKQAAWVDIVATIFIIVIWFFGVTAFSGPVTLLVITPIERMVRLLGMLMLDPLGYQSTARFKKFLLEEDSLIKNTRWTKEVLKGMETSFLMSTILRIGSLMKVGFGTAGVTIIRNNLEKRHGKNLLILNSQGSTVSCIFLFCDIRQFTDATEQLQEEVFVFTNQIAAVVHSICHSYNGAANKNVGDAFLLSWSLDDGPANVRSPKSESGSEKTKLRAKSNQADKALLSVIKICISLQYDKFYLEPLSEAATMRLKSKLKNRPGPVVQMGFGLHAGKAVQGAIGSQRKIDATYVSEAVERAEFLEASTKKYGLNMLMSGSFHKLLHPNTRRRCRMIDKIFIVDEDEDADEDDDELHGEYMELFTFDMDVDAIYHHDIKRHGENDTLSDELSAKEPSLRSRRRGGGDRRSHGSTKIRNRRRGSSMKMSAPPGFSSSASEELGIGSGGVSDGNGHAMHSPSIGQPSVSSYPSNEEGNTATNNTNAGHPHVPSELVLPVGPALYSHNVWQSPDMKRIRDRYVQGLFFQKFHGGLQAYYNKDWDTAQICFQTVADGFNDGPSRYFLGEMKKHNGRPPKDFLTSYTVV